MRREPWQLLLGQAASLYTGTPAIKQIFYQVSNNELACSQQCGVAGWIRHNSPNRLFGPAILLHYSLCNTSHLSFQKKWKRREVDGREDSNFRHSPYDVNSRIQT